MGSKWMAFISGFPQQLHDFFSRPSTRDPEMLKMQVKIVKIFSGAFTNQERNSIVVVSKYLKKHMRKHKRELKDLAKSTHSKSKK